MVLAITPLASAAPSISWTIVYNTTYSGTSFADPNLAVVGNKSDVLFNGAPGNNPNWVHQFDVYFQVSGLAAGEDVKQLACDVNIGNGLTPIAFNPSSGTKFSFNTYEQTSWQAWRVFPPPAQWVTYNMSTFSDCGDAGLPDDLHGLMGFINANVANAGQIGEGKPELFGSVFVKWNGDPTTLGVKESGPILGPTGKPVSSWVVWTDNQSGNSATIATQLNSAADGSMVIQFAAPEPITLAILAIGGTGMLLRRRRA